MSGFVNSDGSALVGGLLPSGSGQSLGLDLLGNLKTSEMLRAALLAGNVFNATMPNLAPASAGFYAFELFNPASAKNIYVFSLLVTANSYNTINFQSTTVEPVLAGSTPATIFNMANAATANVLNAKYSTVAGIPTGGANISQPTQLAPSTIELLGNGAGILLPANQNNGLLLYSYVNANNMWSVTARYVQY